MENELKPLVFEYSSALRFRRNCHRQNLLLKALSQGIVNPEELRRATGFKKMADVYRTLDKLSIRKEYHEALVKCGLSLEVIVQGIKDLCETSKHDSVKLQGYQLLLKSLGLDKYEKEEEAGKNWEETILKLTEQQIKKQLNQNTIEGKVVEYEVNEPPTPDLEQKRREEEKKMATQLYEGK